MTGESTKPTETLGIVGSGAIACGLARVAGGVVWARSRESADRVDGEVGDATITTDLHDLEPCSLVIEAVVEDSGAKRDLLPRIDRVLSPAAIIATTTSSLSVADLARASGRPDRFAGLHVFNPVEKMELVEVSFPREVGARTRERVLGFCAALGKTAIEVPDTPGFVVNRLLFPYLFSAVRLLDTNGIEPTALDECMRLGAGHPMGPLALLDFVGIDVAVAIGESIGADVPERLRKMEREGRLGKKSGAGFYEY